MLFAVLSLLFACVRLVMSVLNLSCAFVSVSLNDFSWSSCLSMFCLCVMCTLFKFVVLCVVMSAHVFCLLVW